MIIGIQAVNIRGTGGLVHLHELVKRADPVKHGFNKIILWVNNDVIDQLKFNKSWITTISVNNMNNILYRLFWLKIIFPKLSSECDVVFTPGGVTGKLLKTPIVSMSQNLLLYEKAERERHTGLSRLRLEMLRYLQTKEFKRVRHIIVLTKYAKKTINQDIGIPYEKMAVIPHGINTFPQCKPHEQLPIAHYSENKPFKLLYVSTINAYKHQKKVIEAVLKLREKKYNITLTLIGGGYEPYLSEINKLIKSTNKNEIIIDYIGAIPRNTIIDYYQSHDLFVYASSCENLPIILLEAMASGLPIASSYMGPMPEVLKDSAVYFDPLNEESIYLAIEKLIDSPKLRQKIAFMAHKTSKKYTWEKCADATFKLLSQVSK